MKDSSIPQLSEWEIEDGLIQARNSPRNRHAKILHKPGDEFNRVFNFIMDDSYMQPHLHPGEEKIEKIYLIQGKIAALFFDERGALKECTFLEKGGTELIEVPAFTWHTYVMLSNHVITYETMMGIYEPETWKNFALWAPIENCVESVTYLNFLKNEVAKELPSTK
jgi:cupin fold WbuC family metalloprotein